MEAYVTTIAHTSKRLRISGMPFTAVYRLVMTTILRFNFRQHQTSRVSPAVTALDWRIPRQI